MTGIMWLFFLLSGCVVGPDYERPQVVTDNEVTKTLNLHPDSRQVVDFQKFQDETLNALIQQALKSNLSVRQAVAALRAARYALHIDIAGLAPTLDATAQYQEIRNSRNMETLLKEDSYQLGIDASWELDIFGHQQRLIEQTAAEGAKSLANLNNVLVSLCAEIARVYYDLRLNEILIKKTKDNIKIQKELQHITNDLYSNGLTDKINLNEADYLTKNTQANIPVMEQKIVANKVALSLLLGILPDEVERYLNVKKDNPIAHVLTYDINSFYTLNADVIRERPDVQMAEADLIGANAAIGVAVAELYPQISFAGLFGFEALKNKPVLNHASWMYELIPSVKLPVFHFGALKNNVLIQKAKKEMALAAYEQAILQAIADIKNALTALNQEQKHNEYLKKAYDRITKAAELTRSKYKAGLINYSQVLDAEERRLSAQTNWLSSNAALYQNIVNFYKVIGVFPK
ncbi:MAG: efflux transporter outer membrane subunit [Alphaproteobacteria bacterium]|nr:efflux transporter outer membrane subunit [Alphaproteobacteria bacterium]